MRETDEALTHELGAAVGPLRYREVARTWNTIVRVTLRSGLVAKSLPVPGISALLLVEADSRVNLD